MSVRHQRRDDNDKMASEGDGLSTTARIRPRRLNFTSTQYHSVNFIIRSSAIRSTKR